MREKHHRVTESQVFHNYELVNQIKVVFLFLFIKGMDRRRLTYQQRSFAGNRFSDHVAMLNAFQAWEEARLGGEQAEMAFCDHKMLSLPTLRVTWEAKVSITYFHLLLFDN